MVNIESHGFAQDAAIGICMLVFVMLLDLAGAYADSFDGGRMACIIFFGIMAASVGGFWMFLSLLFRNKPMHVHKISSSQEEDRNNTPLQ